MTGIDLFKALGGVKEEYIAEADGSRKLPHVKNITLQWCAALAACVCLLLGWGFIAQHLGGIADYTGDETKVTGAAETAQADGADQGAAPAIGSKVVLPVRITAETSGDPNAYGGSANIFTLEYANGETSTITVYGNLFYKKDDGPWCDIPYEQAEKLEELVRSLGSDE